MKKTKIIKQTVYHCDCCNKEFSFENLFTIIYPFENKQLFMTIHKGKNPAEICSECLTKIFNNSFNRGLKSNG